MSHPNTDRDERVSTTTVAGEIAQRYYPDDDELADAIRRALDVERNQRDKSLLSSEVARAIALHIKGKNSDYFHTSEGLAELEAIISRHFVVAAQSDAATRMRDHCVEKVKNAIHDLSRTAIAAEQNAKEIDLLIRLREELKSLTLDDKEKR